MVSFVAPEETRWRAVATSGEGRETARPSGRLARVGPWQRRTRARGNERDEGIGESNRAGPEATSPSWTPWRFLPPEAVHQARGTTPRWRRPLGAVAAHHPTLGVARRPSGDGGGHPAASPFAAASRGPLTPWPPSGEPFYREGGRRARPVGRSAHIPHAIFAPAPAVGVLTARSPSWRQRRESLRSRRVPQTRPLAGTADRWGRLSTPEAGGLRR